MTLADFIGKHTGATCWLFGKGPSLDLFPMESAGPLRASINDACVVVPSCRYAFANDGIQKWIHHLTDSITLFQPARALKEFDSARASLTSPVVVYQDDYGDRITTDPAKLAQCMRIRRGTVCSALQVLFLMGVSNVVMVGFDGTGTHSKAAAWSNRIRNDSAKEYAGIKDAAIETAEELGLTLKFFTEPNTNMENGKIKVTITRSCFVAGQPITAGQTIEVIPIIARQLIACGSAEVSKELPPIETAEAPIKARENAMVKTAKRKI